MARATALASQVRQDLVETEFDGLEGEIQGRGRMSAE